MWVDWGSFAGHWGHPNSHHSFRCGFSCFAVPRFLAHHHGNRRRVLVSARCGLRRWQSGREPGDGSELAEHPLWSINCPLWVRTQLSAHARLSNAAQSDPTTWLHARCWSSGYAWCVDTLACRPPLYGVTQDPHDGMLFLWLVAFRCLVWYPIQHGDYKTLVCMKWWSFNGFLVERSVIICCPINL